MPPTAHIYKESTAFSGSGRFEGGEIAHKHKLNIPPDGTGVDWWFCKISLQKIGRFNKSLTEPCGRILQSGRYNDTSFAGKRSANETETPLTGAGRPDEIHWNELRRRGSKTK